MTQRTKQARRRRTLATLATVALLAAAGGLPTAAADEPDSSSLRNWITAEKQDAPTVPPLGRDADAEPANRSIFGDRSTRLPKVVEGRFELPPLMAATTETEKIGNGRLPDGFREGDETPVMPVPESATERGFESRWIAGEWAPPNTFANPRYFEDRMLERHGHRRWGHLQPAASGARFFATIPMLPYLMTVKPMADEEYSLGHFRAGSRTPGFFQRPPYERRAAIAEGAAVAGGFVALP